MDDTIYYLNDILRYFNPGIVCKNEIKSRLNDLIDEIIRCLYIPDKTLINEIKANINKPTNKYVKESMKKQIISLLKYLGNTYSARSFNFKKIQHNQILYDEQDEYDMYRDNIYLIENMCDKEIRRYNMFSRTCPMLGIKWNKKTNKWVAYNEMYFDKKSFTTLKNARNYMYSQITVNLHNKEKLGYNYQTCSAIGYLIYKGKYILIYGSKNKPLFDINHIINLLDLYDDYETYNEYKDGITHFGFNKNIYGGFIIKKFIPEEIVYDILMSFNCYFSKKLKSDIVGMLCKLRKNGILQINNDGMELKINNTGNKIDKPLFLKLIMDN